MTPQDEEHLRLLAIFHKVVAALGVCTIIVLMREPVRMAYGQPVSARTSAPPS